MKLKGKYGGVVKKKSDGVVGTRDINDGATGNERVFSAKAEVDKLMRNISDEELKKAKIVASRNIVLDFAKNNFWFYCHMRIPGIYSLTTFHLMIICNDLQRLYDGEFDCYALSMPPRWCKSLTIQLFIEWCIGKNPTKASMYACYRKDLSNTLSAGVRDNLESDVFKLIFPGVVLKSNSKSVEKWSVEQATQHTLLAITVNSGATGNPVNLLGVCDDAVGGIEAAYSPSITSSLKSFYDSEFHVRCQIGAMRVLVGTLWSDQDLISQRLNAEGELKDGGKWFYRKIPALGHISGNTLSNVRYAAWTEDEIEMKIDGLDIAGGVTFQVRESLAAKKNDDGTSVFDWIDLYDTLVKKSNIKKFNAAEKLMGSVDRSLTYDGFTTKSMTDIYSSMKKNGGSYIFMSMYQNSIKSRDNLLFPLDKLNRFSGVIDNYDETLMIVDVADTGKDFLAAIFIKIVGDKVFVDKVIHRQDPVRTTKSMIFAAIVKEKPDRAVFESNKEGSMYADDIEDMLYEYNESKSRKVRTIIEKKYTKQNKQIKLFIGSGAVIERMWFREDYDKGNFDFSGVRFHRSVDLDKLRESDDYRQFMDKLTGIKSMVANQEDGAGDVCVMAIDEVNEISDIQVYT